MDLNRLFAYDSQFPPDWRPAGRRRGAGVESETFTYAAPFGYRRAAQLIAPQKRKAGQHPAVLFVHWLDEAPNANRSQFEAEALQLAQLGAVCLLVETMWSDRDWFIKRSQAEDWENSVRQVVELRQQMDLLLGQHGVDAGNFAFVGHDFGAMYGILAGSIDLRPSCYVLMAGTPAFADWYLYYPPLDEKAQAQFREKMVPLDPVTRVGELAPAPLLFQFGRDDHHVPPEQAEAFYAAAAEPKQIGWYDGGHELDETAREERLAWLQGQLGLASEG